MMRTFFEVKQELIRLRISTRTDGLKGEARLKELNKRLDEALKVQVHHGQQQEQETIISTLTKKTRKKETSYEEIIHNFEAAIARFDFVEICQCIRLGANPNHETKNGDTALLRAIHHGDVEHVERLVQLGAKLNHVTKRSEMSPLVYGCVSSSFVMVEFLIGNYIKILDVNLELPDGRTALTAALKLGRVDPMAKFLVENAQADINHVNKYGNTPLMMCVECDAAMECTKFLLDHGVEDVTKSIELAWRSKKWTIARLLEQHKYMRTIKCSMSIDRRDSMQTKLNNEQKQEAHTMNMLIRDHNMRAIKQKISTGAGKPDHEAPDGETMLIWAAHYGKIEAMVDLIELGANVDYQNRHGTTALMQAARIGKALSVRVLIQALEADIDLQDRKGYSALMHASFKGYRRCVQLLLGAGASTRLSDECGLNASMLAKAGQHHDIASLLEIYEKRQGFVVFGLYCESEEDREALDNVNLEDEKDVVKKVQRRIVLNRPNDMGKFKTHNICLTCHKNVLWAFCQKCRFSYCATCWDRVHGASFKRAHIPTPLTEEELKRTMSPERLQHELSKRKLDELRTLPEALDTIKTMVHDQLAKINTTNNSDKNKDSETKEGGYEEQHKPHVTLFGRLDEKWEERLRAEEETKYSKRFERYQHKCNLLLLAGVISHHDRNVKFKELEPNEHRINRMYDELVLASSFEEQEEGKVEDPKRLFIRPVQLELAEHLIDSKKDLKEGIALATQVLEMQRAALGEQDVVMLRTLKVIGRGLLALGHREQACARLKQAFDICCELEPCDSNIYCDTLEQYTQLLIQAERFEQARNLWKDVVCEHRLKELGMKHPLMRKSLHTVDRIDAQRKANRAFYRKLAQDERNKALREENAVLMWKEKMKSLETFLEISGDEAVGWPMFRQYAFKKRRHQLIHFCDAVRKLNNALGNDTMVCKPCDIRVNLRELGLDIESVRFEGRCCTLCGNELRDEYIEQSKYIFRMFLNSNILGCIPAMIRNEIKAKLKQSNRGEDIFEPAIEAVMRHLHQTLYVKHFLTDETWRDHAPMKYIYDRYLMTDKTCKRMVVKIQSWWRTKLQIFQGE